MLNLLLLLFIDELRILFDFKSILISSVEFKSIVFINELDLFVWLLLLLLLVVKSI